MQVFSGGRLDVPGSRPRLELQIRLSEIPDFSLTAVSHQLATTPNRTTLWRESIMHRIELRTDLEDDKRSGGRQQEECGHRGLG